MESVSCGYGDKIFRRLSQDGVLLGVGRGKIAENCQTRLLFKFLIMCMYILPATGGNSIEGHRLNLSCCSKYSRINTELERKCFNQSCRSWRAVREEVYSVPFGRYHWNLNLSAASRAAILNLRPTRGPWTRMEKKIYRFVFSNL